MFSRSDSAIQNPAARSVGGRSAHGRRPEASLPRSSVGGGSADAPPKNDRPRGPLQRWLRHRRRLSFADEAAIGRLDRGESKTRRPAHAPIEEL